MTNYEKYKEEYEKAVKSGNIIKFLLNHVPAYEDEVYRKNMDDVEALTSLSRWLFAEYKEPEPPVDWAKVAVDTPIYVKNKVDRRWRKAHFKAYKKGFILAYQCGQTSFTSDTISYSTWDCGKLAEPHKADKTRLYKLFEMFLGELAVTVTKDSLIGDILNIQLSGHYAEEQCVMLEIANILKAMHDERMKQHDN